MFSVKRTLNIVRLFGQVLRLNVIKVLLEIFTHFIYFLNPKNRRTEI